MTRYCFEGTQSQQNDHIHFQRFLGFHVEISDCITDPKIDIQFGKDTFRRQVAQDIEIIAEVFCAISAAAGKPSFRIEYEGSGKTTYELIERKTVTYFRKHYYRGHYRALMRIPANGIITCTVTDDLGEYLADRAITVKGRQQAQNTINTGDVWFYSFRTFDI